MRPDAWIGVLYAVGIASLDRQERAANDDATSGDRHSTVLLAL